MRKTILIIVTFFTIMLVTYAGANHFAKLSEQKARIEQQEKSRQIFRDLEREFLIIELKYNAEVNEILRNRNNDTISNND